MTKRARGRALLDALEALEQKPRNLNVWRSVHQGRAPDECSNVSGRWGDGSFDVLYTSLEKQGAIEERRFHLYRGQPVAPSKVSYELFELQIEAVSVIEFPDLESLATAGLNTTKFSKLAYPDRDDEYPRSQEIAEACFFLGADGIVVPGARDDSANLVVFCEQEPRPRIEIIKNHGVINWS